MSCMSRDPLFVGDENNLVVFKRKIYKRIKRGSMLNIEIGQTE